MAAIAAPVLIDLTDRADALPSPPKFREAPTKCRAWELRLEAANKARDAILARKISKAEAMRTLKHEPPAPPAAALLQKLLDRLQSAEVRRDVELESIKYKAKAMAAPLQARRRRRGQARRRAPGQARGRGPAPPRRFTGEGREGHLDVAAQDAAQAQGALPPGEARRRVRRAASSSSTSA